MPRFSLREFSRPDYASSLPKKDPNNAIWPRTSMLAKMLNEIPWFKKSAQDELSEQSAADMEGYVPNSEQQDKFSQQSRAEAQMAGYVPDEEPDGLLHIEDLDADALPSYMGWDFNYETATPEQLMDIQKLLKAGGYDIGKTGPRKDGIDGERGPKTLAAYIDYNKKLQGDRLWNQNRAPDEEQESATFENELEEAKRWSETMDGYKPNTTGGR